MHPSQKVGDPIHGLTHGPEEQSIHHVGFVALPANRGAEMDRHGLPCVLGNVRSKDSLKDNPHRIGKTRCGVRHLREEPGDSTGPELAADRRSLSRPTGEYEPSQEQHDGECGQTVGRRHGKDHRVFCGTAQEYDEAAARQDLTPGLGTQIVKLLEKCRRKLLVR